tara:strand:- start:194 stop:703 length:510 start_codon:yes stop_codon:yes gene_type:complete
MATVGAFNGTSNFLRVYNGTIWQIIGGQVSHTETLTNNLLNITNKEGATGYREYLPSQGIQQVDYTVDCIFNTQAAFTHVRNLASSKELAHFQVLRGDIPTGTVPIEVWLMVKSFNDTSENGSALKATVSFQSSDEFDINANYTYSRLVTSAGRPYFTSIGEYYYVRNP